MTHGSPADSEYLQGVHQVNISVACAHIFPSKAVIFSVSLSMVVFLYAYIKFRHLPRVTVFEQKESRY